MKTLRLSIWWCFCLLVSSTHGQDIILFDSLVMQDARIDNLVEINSKEMDFGPVFWNDLLVYVTNDREGLAIDRRIKEKYFDLKFADRIGTESFERSAFFPEVINSPYHEGPCAFSEDGGVMYFTRDHQTKNRPVRNDQNVVPLQIYTSTLNRDGWSEPMLWEHSDPSALYTHPTLSTSGDTLVFSSNRDGGIGKMDLYISYREGGGWTVPRAIEGVNSVGNEWFARFYNGLLFYSSDQNSRGGDLDISVYNFDTGLSQVLPAPINTGYDDFGFAKVDGNTAIFSSNRPGGMGKDDLYQLTTTIPMVRESDKLVTYLDMTVKDQNTRSIVQGAEFEIVTVRDQKAIIQILLNDEKSKRVLESYYQTISSGIISDEYGRIQLDIEFPALVHIEGYVPGYQDYTSMHYLEREEDLEIVLRPSISRMSTTISPSPTPPNPSPRKVIINRTEVKKGTVLIFNNIYYAYDSHEIEPGSLSELDELANAMLQNPSIKVQLSAHTDSRGESLYNQLLSDKRATYARDYLAQRGVNSSRIVPIGFGESRLRNQCDNGVSCTEAEHKFNRRTEVKILDY